MNATHVEGIATAAAATVSRRRLVRGLAATALTAIAWPESGLRSVAGRTTPAPTTSRGFPAISPDITSPFPIPLGGNRFLMNGRAVAVDLQRVAATFREGAAVYPVEVDEAAFELTPALLARAAQPATPAATPAATPVAADASPPWLTLGEQPVGEFLETGCLGAPDSQDVELYDGTFDEVSIDFVSGHQPMVGDLRWKGDLKFRYTNPGNVNGLRICSGTLIDDNLFLTAGHCITPPSDKGHRVPLDNVTGLPIGNDERATNMRVEFNYQLDNMGTDRSPVEFDVVALVEHHHSTLLDYAILQLDGDPGQSFGVAPVLARDPSPGSSICVIGHPDGVPKRVAAGTAANTVASWIPYRDLNTADGSSGAGILDSPEGPLIGVHIGGNCDKPGGANFAMRIGALLPESPTLQRLARW
jgi:hypothetical protein